MNKTTTVRQFSQQHHGYTLLELAVVVSILAILSALTIPNFFRWVASSRIDAVKTILNSTASECLQGVRESQSPETIIPKDTTVSNDSLATYGYSIKGNANKCDSFFVVPKAQDENFLYEMGFKISPNGDLVKIAVPATDSGSLNSCKNWAGVNCGVSAEQQAIWDALAKIEKDKKTCNDSFYAWLQTPGSGSYNRWETETNTCTLKTWAFEGSIQANEQGYKDAETAKYGRICTDKKAAEKQKGTTGGPMSISECGSNQFYFCKGEDKGTLDAMNACIAADQEAKCISDQEKKRLDNYSGKYGPIQGPGRCGEVVWMCNKTLMYSEAEYNATSCGAPPPPPPCRWPQWGVC